MDLWFIPKDICVITNYKYVLDIIGHFSKWMWAFPVKNKTKEEILLKLKTFITALEKPKYLYTDNGCKFKNNLLDNYCNENEIIYNYSKPYTPRSAGAVEAVHKQIKRIVMDLYYTNEDKDLSLEEALLKAINYHNYNEHSTTKYKPIDLQIHMILI